MNDRDLILGSSCYGASASPHSFPVILCRAEAVTTSLLLLYSILDICHRESFCQKEESKFHLFTWFQNTYSMYGCRDWWDYITSCLLFMFKNKQLWLSVCSVHGDVALSVFRTPWDSPQGLPSTADWFHINIFALMVVYNGRQHRGE